MKSLCLQRGEGTPVHEICTTPSPTLASLINGLPLHVSQKISSNNMAAVAVQCFGHTEARETGVFHGIRYNYQLGHQVHLNT